MINRIPDWLSTSQQVIITVRWWFANDVTAWERDVKLG